MDRGAWQATVHRVTRLRHNLATKPPPSESLICFKIIQFLRMCSVRFSRSVVSSSLRPHKSQHARPPCPMCWWEVKTLLHKKKKKILTFLNSSYISFRPFHTVPTGHWRSISLSLIFIDLFSYLLTHLPSAKSVQSSISSMVFFSSKTFFESFLFSSDDLHLLSVITTIIFKYLNLFIIATLKFLFAPSSI